MTHTPRDVSNSALRIAELRRRIASNKGIAQRARDSALLLQIKARNAEWQIRKDQDEIEAMGGRVRR
jgi:hypothetical protein